MPRTSAAVKIKADTPFWQNKNGTARLLCADATHAATLPRNTVELTVTSPPYNLGMNYSGDSSDDFLEYAEYLKFSAQWLKNCHNWTKNTGRLCLNIGLDKNKGGKRPVCADLTHAAMKVGWKYHATIIWNEGNISRHTAWGSWKSASAPHIIAPVEVIIVLYKGAWKRQHRGENDISGDDFKTWVKGVWSFPGESAKRVGHEAPFPRELPKRCIKLFSFVGDTVLDPFCGSGTTLIEALANNRHAIGIEKEKKYCELSKERIAKEVQSKIL